MIIKTIVLLNIFLPSILFSFGASSMFFGLLLGNILSVMYYLLIYNDFFYKKIFNKDSKTKYLILILIIIHGFLCFIINIDSFDFNRFLLSVSLIIFLMIMSDFLFKLIEVINYDKFYNLFKFASYIFLFCGLLLIFQFSEFLHFKEILSIKIFSEPGHFVLELLPILLFITLVKINKYFNFIVITFIIIFIINVKSFLFIFGLFFIITIKLILRKKFRPYYFLFFICFILYFINNDIDYYTSRINFQDKSDVNLSKLVFLDGLDRAYNYFIQTNGLGIGLQQFGIVKLNSGRSFDIDNILSELNISVFDGGTLAAKIFGEFGFFSFLFIFNYFLFIRRCFLNIDKIYNSHPIYLLAFSYLLFFSLQLFLRTSGYFSFFMFALLVSYNLLINLLNTNITGNIINNKVFPKQ
jgi:hypothetical protein